MDLKGWEASLRDILPQVVAFRRDLHMHPELSGQEHRTREQVISRLSGLGLEIHAFEDCCSVMGTLRNGSGRCVAVRADMDALPVREETGLPFASLNEGVMHACGHDMHMAIALGSALWLSGNLDKWHGTVKWLFESEEETVGGGQRMVAQGCMRDPRVDAVIGQHMNPSWPVGTFYAKSGFQSGSSDELHLTVTGTACHGAYPERGTDAIVIAAQIITAMQSLVSRTISPFDPVALTFGTVEGGTANNVVCGEVRLSGTLRTLKPETREAMRSRMKALAEGIAAAMGGSASLDIRPSYGAVYNDPACYEKVRACAEALLGPDRLVEQPAPSLGVESFSYFLQETPGMYYDLGSGVGTGLHTATFCADEAVLLPGIALQCEIVLTLLKD